jgi:hypothetical protein
LPATASPSLSGSPLQATEAAGGVFVDVQDDDVISAATAELAGHVRGGKDLPDGIACCRIDGQQHVRSHRSSTWVITSLTASVRPGAC